MNKSILRALAIIAAAVAVTRQIPAETLSNAGFETGDLSGWSTITNQLSIATDTNNTFNQNYAARLQGSFCASSPITNTLSQSINVAAGDQLHLLGFVHWATNSYSSSAGTGTVCASLSDTFGAVTSATWNAAFDGWRFFDLHHELFGIHDRGFESGGLSAWDTGCDDLTASVQAAVADVGDYALEMAGTFDGWSWNQVYQLLTLTNGDVIHARARINVEELNTTGSWVVAGIKLEKDGGGYGVEDVIQANTNSTGWQDLSFVSAPITNSGLYIFRCMICGYGAATCTVYFDDILVWREEDSTDGLATATVSLSFEGFSGGASETGTVDLYWDSIALDGSSANPLPATNIYTTLRAEAESIATNPAADIPAINYPPLYVYVFPIGDWGVTDYPSYVEVGFASWTNGSDLICTNVIILYRPDNDSTERVLEFDSYGYLGAMAHTERGEGILLDTNSPPYFMLGSKDGSSAEFGTGPFAETHTYVIGTPLTNFPRKMTTAYGDGWPSRLEIVFTENAGACTSSLWTKHFILASIVTNSDTHPAKGVKICLYATTSGTSNDISYTSQEILMGGATEPQMYGRVDYPNVTYQDHNAVSLRAPWLYNLLDDGTGWWMQQRPRGSATIEPMTLYVCRDCNWVERPYEEYLFTWFNAASGVRSVFEDDYADRIPGQASYHVGFKIGHMYGTNEDGTARYPEVINIRGNGYFRMADYDGVMAGSFRPLAADIFGLYQFSEDAPLIPKAYSRMVPRTTPTNGTDDSYAQVFLSARSKTNNWFTSAMEMELHLSPDEVVSNGCFFDLELDTYANRAVTVTNDGALAAFDQVSMHWRGGSTNMGINDHTEGHDIDVVILKRSDGEWITHQVLNPPTNLYHRVLGTFASNDVVYLMQQDRAPYSYGFSTEQPYRKACSFEITLLDDAGRDLTLDVYEQNTASEISDNVNIAANFSDDLSSGEHLHYKYRYRSIYAPGVYIIHPNQTSGGDNWTNGAYTIEFYATDGDDEPLQADIYYGNGCDDDWHLINTNQTINVDTSTHYASWTWDLSGVATGAYYIKVVARRGGGGKPGFDVSNSRLMVEDTLGFPHNGHTNVTIITNDWALLGNDMSFESGNKYGWGTSPTNWSEGNDDLEVHITSDRSWEGGYSARMHGGAWTGWSFNNIYQQIPCTSGEVLYVTGRVYLAQLGINPGSTNWLKCGIKLEPTNGTPSTAEDWLTPDDATACWHTLTFSCNITNSGTRKLILYVMGYDATGADVYFDRIDVFSTNTGTIVTNETRTSYWLGDPDTDVSDYDLLTFWISAANPIDYAEIWAADSSGVTNTVPLTNFLSRIISLQRRVDVPWTNFTTIDRTHLHSIGFNNSTSNSLSVADMRSRSTPMRISSSVPATVRHDQDGLPLFNPGDVLTNIISIQNLSGNTLTGLRIQVDQEYAETTLWWDSSPGVSPVWSCRTRKGDRLCGEYEQIWTNMSIPAGSTLVITNLFTLPYGQRVDHTRYKTQPGEYDWFFDRNYAGHARSHLVIRRSNGDNFFADDQIVYYSMDDDFDVDNDGLPDSYELEHSGSYTGMQASADDDGDGRNNLREFVAGTCPTNAASFLDLDHIECEPAAAVELQFDTVTGRVYWAEWCSNLLEHAWSPVSTNLLDGDGGLKTIIDYESLYVTSRYYRIGVKLGQDSWPR